MLKASWWLSRKAEKFQCLTIFPLHRHTTTPPHICSLHTAAQNSSRRPCHWPSAPPLAKVEMGGNKLRHERQILFVCSYFKLNKVNFNTYCQWQTEKYLHHLVFLKRSSCRCKSRRRPLWLSLWPENGRLKHSVCQIFWSRFCSSLSPGSQFLVIWSHWRATQWIQRHAEDRICSHNAKLLHLQHWPWRRTALS